MRKKVFGRKFGRGKDSRKAFFRSLTRALVLNGGMETTKARAKAIQADFDKLITLAKRDTVSAKRIVLGKLGNDREVAESLFNTYLPSLGNRNSGYTRIRHLPRRSGDQAQMVKLEFVDTISKVEPKAKDESKAKETKNNRPLSLKGKLKAEKKK